MLTQEQLKELLSYDPETGIFTWLKAVSKSVRVGSIAGSFDKKGYIRIGLLRRRYSAHRLAFLYMTGSFPPNDTDHINGVRNDNRWINLRQATNSENQRNQGKPITNTSGYKGVSWNKRAKKWLAKIKHMNHDIHLGYFDSPEAAHQAYIEAAEKLHGDFANY